MYLTLPHDPNTLAHSRPSFLTVTHMSRMTLKQKRNQKL